MVVGVVILLLLVAVDVVELLFIAEKDPDEELFGGGFGFCWFAFSNVSCLVEVPSF